MIRHNGITIDRKNRTISHDGETYRFLRPKRGADASFAAVCHLILGSGMSTHELFHLVYGDDPDGGPEAGHHVFNIKLYQWKNLFLTRLGLEWRSWRISGVTFYCIVPIYQLRNPLHRQPIPRRRAEFREAAE